MQLSLQLHPSTALQLGALELELALGISREALGSDAKAAMAWIVGRFVQRADMLPEGNLGSKSKFYRFATNKQIQANPNISLYLHLVVEGLKCLNFNFTEIIHYLLILLSSVLGIVKLANLQNWESIPRKLQTSEAKWVSGTTCMKMQGIIGFWEMESHWA